MLSIHDGGVLHDLLAFRKRSRAGLQMISLRENEVLHDLLAVEGEAAQCGTRRGRLVKRFWRRRFSPATQRRGLSR
jgi:hypothetical protein